MKVRLFRPWILFPYKSLKSQIALTLKIVLLLVHFITKRCRCQFPTMAPMLLHLDKSKCLLLLVLFSVVVYRFDAEKSPHKYLL